MSTKPRVSLKHLRMIGCIALFVALIDQGTKQIILHYLTTGDSITVIPGYFNLILTYNYGAAFGIMSDLPHGVRQATLAITTVLALSTVGYLLYRDYAEDRKAQIALALIVGGAVGNIIDRVRQGKVTDFLDFYYGSYHWPAFNIADTAICIGVGVLILLRPIKHSVEPSRESGSA